MNSRSTAGLHLHTQKRSKFCFTQEEHFKRFKSAAANFQAFNYCSELQRKYRALPYRYKANLMKRSLLSSLQEGGYIFYARHGDATVGVDLPHLNLQDCSTQRNLSETGRRQAIEYGGTFRRLRIPLMYPIMTSPFCRNIETAQLAFGAANVRVDPFWLNIYYLSRYHSQTEQSTILNSLNTILEAKPPSGRNKVIIAHSFPSGIGLGPIPNMGTVIVKPLGKGDGYEIVTLLTLEELISLY